MCPKHSPLAGTPWALIEEQWRGQASSTVSGVSGFLSLGEARCRSFIISLCNNFELLLLAVALSLHALNTEFQRIVMEVVVSLK